jgi:hypothetical protein
LNSIDQVVPDNGFAEWAWCVIPLKSGAHKLYIQVSAKIILPFGKESVDHPIIDKEIQVNVNPVYSLKCFVKNYWRWIISAIIIPFLGYVINNYFSSIANPRL